MLLMRGENAESLLQAQERLRPQLDDWIREGLIGGYTLAADRLPSAARQHVRQQALPDTEVLQQRLVQAGEGLPFRATAFSPFVEAVEQSRSLPPLTINDVRETTLGLPLAGLLFERNGMWWGVVRLAGVGDVTALQQRLATSGGTLRYVDLKAVTGGMLERFRLDALRNLLWGALAIMLVIGWRSGGLRRVWQVGLPLAAAIALTLALLHGLGERLTLFHLTSLLLVMGIGIDYGLFFSRSGALAERGRTFHALQVCAISTATVFAILALSRLPVLHAIGLTVLIGVVAAYWLARISGAGVKGEQGSPRT
jgi:predicted exporter